MKRLGDRQKVRKVSESAVLPPFFTFFRNRHLLTEFSPSMAESWWSEPGLSVREEESLVILPAGSQQRCRKV